MGYPEYFTTFDIVRKLGIKRERLKNWIEQGYVKPSFQEKIGPGMKSHFRRWDLYVIKLFAHLLNFGFSRAEAAKWIEYLFRFDPNNEDSPEPKPLRDGKGPDWFVLVRKGSEAIRCETVWGPTPSYKKDLGVDDLFIVNFDKIRRQVDDALEG